MLDGGIFTIEVRWMECTAEFSPSRFDERSAPEALASSRFDGRIAPEALVPSRFGGRSATENSP
jgi:hypothetical protein